MYKILKNGKKIESEIPGIYGGYKVDKIFGTLSCKSGMRMKKENRVFFHSLEDAVTQGYRPCKNCKPIGEKEFQTIKHLIPEKTLEEFYNRKNRKIKTFESFHSDIDPYGEETWGDNDNINPLENDDRFFDEENNGGICLICGRFSRDLVDDVCPYCEYDLKYCKNCGSYMPRENDGVCYDCLEK